MDKQASFSERIARLKTCAHELHHIGEDDGSIDMGLISDADRHAEIQQLYKLGTLIIRPESAAPPDKQDPRPPLNRAPSTPPKSVTHSTSKIRNLLVQNS